MGRESPPSSDFQFRLMNPSLIDPNNHAPEVSPADGWDDAKGFTHARTAAATVLPPRRTLAEKAASAPVENEPAGLRIESNVGRRENNPEGPRLEVQEISSGVIRLEQTAPAPLKVPRQVVFQERQPQEDRSKNPRGEGREWGVAGQQSMRWIVGTGIGITALIVVSLMLLPMINKSNAARSSSADQQTEALEEEPIEGMDALNLLLSKQPEAEQIFAAYARARVADDVMALVSDPGSVRETLRKNWQPMAISSDWMPAEGVTWQIQKANNHSYGVLEGTLPDFSKFAAYFTFKGNHLLMDWKATTGFGTATFDELSKSQGDAREIRGVISPSDYYTATWPETEYRSFQLIAPAGEKSIWCYARRSDAAEIALAELFQTGEILQESLSARKVTVRLEHGPDGALPNQWQVAELLHIDWTNP